MQQHQLWAKRLLWRPVFFFYPKPPDFTPCKFFLWEFVKEAVHVRLLPTTLVYLKNRIATAVNLVTQDILLRVWNEFSYSFNVFLAAGGGTLSIYKHYCKYIKTLCLSLVPYLIYKRTKLSQSVWITLYFTIIHKCVSWNISLNMYFKQLKLIVESIKFTRGFFILRYQNSSTNSIDNVINLMDLNHFFKWLGQRTKKFLAFMEH
jgi:hypothetical protein